MAIKEVEKDGKKMLEYRFQPTLEDGTPIGGEQVIYGDNHEQITDGIANNYTHLHRKNRELILKDKVAAPAGTTPAVDQPRFQPRLLTADERMKLSRDLTDPAKVDEALDLVIEAKLGAKPEKVSQSIDKNARDAAVIRAEQEGAAWRDSHPEFFASPKNCKDIVDWVKNRNMEISVENLNKALTDLAPALETKTASPEGTPAKAQGADADSRIAATADGSGQPQDVPTSTRRSTGSTRGAVKKESMDIGDFRKMPNDERRKFMKEHPGYEFSSK